MANLSKTTRDHDEIRRWAEERGGKPAHVKSTGSGEDTGILRIDFPGYSGGGSLEPISWEDFFEKFDDRGLALVYQEETAGGQKSNFNKLVSAETAAESGSGRGRQGRSRSTGSSFGASKTSKSARTAKKGGASKKAARSKSARSGRAVKKAASASSKKASSQRTSARKGGVEKRSSRSAVRKKASSKKRSTSRSVAKKGAARRRR
jgi:hypothetical protein